MARGKAPSTAQPQDTMRLDKWLWAARFFKTRALAVDAIDAGHVTVNALTAKKSTVVHVGAEISFRAGHQQRAVVVMQLSATRGPAPVAQTLYTETADSIAAREAQALQRRLAPEPAWQRDQGRPTKRDRRQLQTLNQPEPRWNERWSARLDD